MLAKSRSPRQQRPRSRAILPGHPSSPVSSMKISRSGSRVDCSSNQASRAARTSARSCSRACPVFFHRHPAPEEEPPERADPGPNAALGGQALPHLGERDVDRPSSAPAGNPRADRASRGPDGPDAAPSARPSPGAVAPTGSPRHTDRTAPPPSARNCPPPPRRAPAPQIRRICRAHASAPLFGHGIRSARTWESRSESETPERALSDIPSEVEID